MAGVALAAEQPGHVFGDAFREKHYGSIVHPASPLPLVERKCPGTVLHCGCGHFLDFIRYQGFHFGCSKKRLNHMFKCILSMLLLFRVFL